MANGRRLDDQCKRVPDQQTRANTHCKRKALDGLAAICKRQKEVHEDTARGKYKPKNASKDTADEPMGTSEDGSPSDAPIVAATPLRRPDTNGVVAITLFDAARAGPAGSGTSGQSISPSSLSSPPAIAGSAAATMPPPANPRSCERNTVIDSQLDN